MRNNVMEAIIGAVVLVVAGFFLVFAYTRSDVRQVSGYDVTADFNQVSGITVGSDVRMSGIKIGSVINQHLDPASYQAVLGMSIDNRVKIPEDSSAKITSDGLLGSSYVMIEPGGSPDLLKNGGQIQYTQGAVDLMSLLGQAVFQMGTNDKKKYAEGAGPRGSARPPSGSGAGAESAGHGRDACRDAAPRRRAVSRRP
jgi:phospholipid/cholesterol/gamma-HCH transport system substrate-binding protein